MNPTAANPMRGQTLYLLPKDGAVQVLLQGRTHLQVLREQGQPVPAIPIKLVSRIVCNARTHWHGAALLACLQHGIPIAHQDAKANTLGYTLAKQVQSTPAPRLLQLAHEDPQWPSRYSQWLENHHLSAVARALLACGLPITAATRREPERHLALALEHKHHQDCTPWVMALNPLVEQEITALLEAHYQDPRLILSPKAPLAQDLGQLLKLTVYKVVFFQHSLHGNTPEQCTHWARSNFARNHDHWESAMGQLLHHLDEHLEQSWA
jgi:hypothetical protein